MDREFARKVLVDAGFGMQPNFENLLDGFLDGMDRNYSKPILPTPTETLALTFDQPKIAALSFDRIYGPSFEDAPPDDLRFYGATKFELEFLATLVAIKIGREYNLDVSSSYSKEPSEINKKTPKVQNLTNFARRIELGLSRTPTLIFGDNEQMEAELPPGAQAVLATALKDVALVSEDHLSWSQVLEFRQDTEARKKYRRFINWLDKEIEAKGSNAIIDTLAVRMDDYEWALKKHGIHTTLGTISCLLDPKYLIGISAATAASSLTTSEVWTAVAGTSLVVGKAIVSASTLYIEGMEKRRKDNYEVAYLYEIKKRLSHS
jgi:hypothetical protein